MKIILFGSTGMLGRYVLSVLDKNYEVVSFLRNDYDIKNDSNLKLENLLSILQENDVVINCSGLIPQNSNNDNNLRDYIKINSIFPNILNNICNKINCKFIHITTDCVFSGLKGNYNENDIHDSKTHYGITKSFGENETSTIIRTSIIGEELYNKNSLLEWLISNKNKTINGYTNHFWNGVTCLTLAKIIKNIIDKNLYWKGVRHIYSSDSVTKYDLCSYINKIYNLNINIEKKEKDYKNLTLSSIYDKVFEIDTIYNQLVEQYEYKVNFGTFENLLLCRFCGNKDLCEIFKFNDYPLSGSFLKNIKNKIYEKIYPLTFLFCDKCQTGLVKEIVKEDYLFKNINESSYFYYSSTIPSLVKHFKNLYEKIILNYPDKKKILEIGCNDGVFINNFSGKNYNIIGIDPSKTILNITLDDIIKYNTFFNEESANDILNKYGKQEIIVSCNCLAHINNMYDIYSNIKNILDDNGIFIIEIHYLKNIIDNLNFDFIYHEHMSYYSINTLIQICKNHDFYIEDIEFINTHGGSIRAFIRHKITNNYYNTKIQEYIIKENEYKEKLVNLFDNLYIWKKNILSEIKNVQNENLLVGYGASGRTNMIINYLSTKFDIILDDSINKINSYIPYYHTKIENSEYIYKNNDIKVILILAWTYTDSIIKKHIEFIKNGGIFIKILPSIERIDINNYINYIM